jgi:hypothetical protein
VVEEAAVLAQRRVVRGREGPDERVREHDPAHDVAREAPLERLGDRALHELFPDAVVAHAPPDLRLRAQGLRERREDGPRHPSRGRVEGVPRVGLARVAGHGEHGGPGPRGVLPVDEQPAVAGRRIGGDPPGRNPQVEVELPRQRAREERHEIGVARQARVHAAPGALGHRRPAEMAAALEDDHGAAGACEEGRGDESVVAAPDDDGVVGRARGLHSPHANAARVFGMP